MPDDSAIKQTVPYARTYNELTGRCARCKGSYALAELRTFTSDSNPAQIWGRPWRGSGFELADEAPTVIVTCLYCMTPDELIQEFGSAALVILDALARITIDPEAEGDNLSAQVESLRHIEHVRCAIFYRRGTDAQTSLTALSRAARPAELRAAYDKGRADATAQTEELAREEFTVKGSMPDPLAAAHTLTTRLREYTGVKCVTCVILPDGELRVTVAYDATAAGDFDDSALFLLERDLGLSELETERVNQ